MRDTENIVISLGGSLIAPEEIDITFLKTFHKTIVSHLDKKKRFFIITGGGKTARKYQQAAREITDLTRDDLDWLGIHSTRLNAHLIRTIFRDHAHPRIINHPRLKESVVEPVVVAAGWRPGWSTDFIAAKIASSYGAKTIINLSDISYVYDKDPNKFQDARPVKAITWTDFRKIVGDKWDPGLSLPFDPIASKFAHREGIRVIVMNGRDLENFNSFLKGKSFEGTIIS